MNKQSTYQKRLIYKRLNSLERFNEWEKNHIDKMEEYQRLAAVFGIYDLIPENARQREVNVKGIMKMRKALSCLK
jgi:predicted xylose isomerase-like sugar epimerase